MIISKICTEIYLPDIFILYSQTFTSSLKLQNIFHDPQTMTPVSPYFELINNIYKLSLNEYNLALVQRQRQDFGFYCLPDFSVKSQGNGLRREMCTTYKLTLCKPPLALQRREHLDPSRFQTLSRFPPPPTPWEEQHQFRKTTTT